MPPQAPTRHPNGVRRGINAAIPGQHQVRPNSDTSYGPLTGAVNNFDYSQYVYTLPTKGDCSGRSDELGETSTSQAFDIPIFLEHAQSRRREVSGHETSYGDPLNGPAIAGWSQGMLTVPTGDGAIAWSSVSSSPQPEHRRPNYPPSYTTRTDSSPAGPPLLYDGSASASDYTQSQTPFDVFFPQLHDQYSRPVEPVGVSADDATKELGTHLDLQFSEEIHTDDEQLLGGLEDHHDQNNIMPAVSLSKDSRFSFEQERSQGSGVSATSSHDRSLKVGMVVSTPEHGLLQVITSNYQKPRALDPEHTDARRKERHVSLRQSRSITRKDDNGHIVGVETMFGQPQTRRGPKDSETRDRVAFRRRMKSCPNCKRLKKACICDSIYEVCNKCRGTAQQYNCKLDVSLDDLDMLRNPVGAIDVSRDAANLKHYLSQWPRCDITGSRASDDRNLILTQDLGKLTIEVSARRCESLSESFVVYTGQSKTGKWMFQLPPYCLHDLRGVQATVFKYAKVAIKPCLKESLAHCDVFVGRAFLIACHSTDKLLNDCIALWAVCRLMERTWYLVPPDILGISLERSPDDPWPRRVPVPPIMNQQVNHVLTETLLPIRDRIRDRLAASMKDSQTAEECRTSLCLAIVILLNNLERQNAHERRICKRYGLPGRFWGDSPGDYPLWRIRYHSANIMLAYYHHILSRDMASWCNDSHTASDAGASTEERTRRLMAEARSNTTTWKQLRTEHQYEQDMYWVHQMFSGRWRPDNIQVVELSATD